MNIFSKEVHILITIVILIVIIYRFFFYTEHYKTIQIKIEKHLKMEEEKQDKVGPINIPSRISL